MANNLLALPGIGAGPPLEAEYEAVYAAVTATERGRWFLTEFASRNRHADTGSLVAALARIEAALSTKAHSHQSIATPNLTVAAEKIADIAFGLRERGADPALCDALDAAARQAGAAAANGAGVLDHAGSGALLEADEAAPVGETQAAAADCTAETANQAKASADFEFEVQDKEKFAAAAAAFAASLGALERQSGEETQTPSSAEQLPTDPVILPHDYIAAAVFEVQPEPVAKPARWYIEAPDFVFQPTARPANGHADAPSSNNTGELQPLRVRSANPEEDPAELFEPASPSAVKSSSAALRVPVHAPAAPATAKIAVAPEPAAPPVMTTPRQMPISPLAALRALSQDELLALFG